MNWHSVGEFFTMGGAAFFVWGSYGVALILIVLEIWLLLQRRRELVRQLWRRQQLETNSVSPPVSDA